jgi:LysR family tcuABC transcriptional regulator
VQNLSNPQAADAKELKQLRYFVRVVELGSISRAALDLNLVQSVLSQQIT